MQLTIAPSIIEEIRAQTDLADLIASYGITLKRAGGHYMACCPFHKEKTPSFHIHSDKGMYHCFGCGESGDVFKFVQKQEGLTFIESVKKLAALCNITIEEREDKDAELRRRLYALHAELAQFYRRCLLQAKEAEAARRYLDERGLNEEIGEKFLIGYAPLHSDAILKWAQKYKFKTEELHAAGIMLPPKYSNGRWYNRFGGRLMFTIRDRSGRAVGFSGRTLSKDKAVAKYVNSPETVIFKKSNVLFAYDVAGGEIVKAPRREAIVCEGQIDVIRCHACGFKTAVASQGTAFTEEHVRILKKCAESVVLVFDGDGAGQKAAIRTGGEFLAADVPVRVATLPPGEDPDSLLRTKGVDAFQSCLENAESITRFQVRTLREKETNPDSIDAVTRVSRQALMLISQCPSAVIRANLMQEAADLLGIPVEALNADFEAAKKEAEAKAVKQREIEKRLQQKEKEEVDAPLEEMEETPPVEDVFAGKAADDISVNPPPEREMAFCEFLFSHEHDEALAAEVKKYVNDKLFSHEFTWKFVEAWLKEVESDGDQIVELREFLSLSEGDLLDQIMLSTDRTGFSELEPEVILREFLRNLWSDAVHRMIGSLSASSTDQDCIKKRMDYSLLTRKFMRDQWQNVAPLMTSSTLQ